MLTISSICFFALLLCLFHSLNDCFPTHPVLLLTIPNDIKIKDFHSNIQKERGPTLILDFNQSFCLKPQIALSTITSKNSHQTTKPEKELQSLQSPAAGPPENFSRKRPSEKSISCALLLRTPPMVHHLHTGSLCAYHTHNTKSCGLCILCWDNFLNVCN